MRVRLRFPHGRWRKRLLQLPLQRLRLQRPPSRRRHRRSGQGAWGRSRRSPAAAVRAARARASAWGRGQCLDRDQVQPASRCAPDLWHSRIALGQHVRRHRRREGAPRAQSAAARQGHRPAGGIYAGVPLVLPGGRRRFLQHAVQESGHAAGFGQRCPYGIRAAEPTRRYRAAKRASQCRCG